jgi:hypothetical protein
MDEYKVESKNRIVGRLDLVTDEHLPPFVDEGCCLSTGIVICNVVVTNLQLTKSLFTLSGDSGLVLGGNCIGRQPSVIAPDPARLVQCRIGANSSNAFFYNSVKYLCGRVRVLDVVANSEDCLNRSWKPTTSVCLMSLQTNVINGTGARFTCSWAATEWWSNSAASGVVVNDARSWSDWGSMRSSMLTFVLRS